MPREPLRRGVRAQKRALIIRIGAAHKAELLSRLDAADVKLNDYARALFADDRFTTSPAGSTIEIKELKVSELGLREGGTYERIVAQAKGVGLSECPLEAAPHLRLQSLDQPEGSLDKPPSRHCAPYGSVTVAALLPAGDLMTGFYLRRIDGELWLRGFRCSADHGWSPEDVFAFAAISGRRARRGSPSRAR